MKSLIIALQLLVATLTAQYPILPPKTQQSVISGHGWAYTVPFEVQNSSTIEKLIQCESQGVNIARPDSNGKESYGLLQFNGTSTWAEAEHQFDFYGSPMIPAEAIHMADMMISGGEIRRWTCARILALTT